ncbi:MAG: hypothetical protein NC915_00970 [Candidatus Omnitrophica bacterium]|nr:hypothetical protein [Candidatus Omnitrophota bacterium]
MKRLGPQTKKLFEVKKREEEVKDKFKKYTFIFPVDLMKKVKHKAIEEEKTVSQFLIEAIKNYLKIT